MNDEQLLRYSRHILLDEVGTQTQERWINSHVVIIGVGGLGSHVAQFLTAAGVGQITICDHDSVDLTNLQRQTMYNTADIGKPKVEAACMRLLTLNPDIRVRTKDQRLGQAELTELAQSANLMIDCTDNYATRHAINRACAAAKIPHVSGAVIRFDGQITVFDHSNPDAPCYHCVFGEEETLEEARCATLGVFAPLVGMVGCMEAGEALKILGGFGEPLTSRMLMINALTMEMHTVLLRKNPKCPVCGGGK